MTENIRGLHWTGKSEGANLSSEEKLGQDKKGETVPEKGEQFQGAAGRLM